MIFFLGNKVKTDQDLFRQKAKYRKNWAISELKLSWNWMILITDQLRKKEDRSGTAKKVKGWVGA